MKASCRIPVNPCQTSPSRAYSCLRFRSFIESLILLFQIPRGLRCFLFPGGFRKKIFLRQRSSGILNTCPDHFNDRFSILPSAVILAFILFLTYPLVFLSSLDILALPLRENQLRLHLISSSYSYSKSTFPNRSIKPTPPLPCLVFS